ncbi:DEAD/DEAH box helicase [Rhodopila globiformis]|uniref:Helicase SNF n=1 Tax=Rhodopila globiformis TaxID=1071 RepID=A0A2S6N796_RHOGL|nr:DEAD/DEAH box helicase [Rhodopila globiformis]PPQ30483.1 helicase SNF [Rhodopila globiformis]
MNVIAANAHSAALWDRYVRLRPDARLILRLKSLIVPAVTKAEFLQCLTRTGLRTQTGKVWAAVTINPITNDLLSQGLLNADLECVPGLLHLVAVDAGASADAKVMAQAIRLTFPTVSLPIYYRSYSDVSQRNAMQRLIRLEVYTNDEVEFRLNRNYFEKTYGPLSTLMFLANSFYDVPLEADWIATRHPVIQAPLLESRLNSFIVTGLAGSAMPGMIALCRTLQGQEGFAGLRAELLRYDLLAGRLDDVRDAAKTVEDPAGDARQSLEGAVAFLEGRNDAALLHYREALKLRRKRIGKRKIFLEREHRVLFLLALLRANDAALHSEIQAGLDAAVAEQESAARDGGLQAIQAMLWLVQGLEAKARELVGDLRKVVPTSLLGGACVALAAHVVDAAISRAARDEYARRFVQFRDVLPLIARIYAEILAEVAVDPASYRAWLDGAGGIAFTRIIQTLQPWERALESLDVFLGGGDAAGDAAKTQRKAKRLVWFLDPDSGDVTVAEQSAKGRDGWTDGRAVAMKRLYEQDPRLDYLTPQDRVALRTIRKEPAGWYGEETFYFDVKRTLPALVGHPAVFHAGRRSLQLELVSYPVELLVTEERGGYRIALSHTAPEPTVFIEAETPSRYRVVEFPQKLMAVQEILTEWGLSVPAAARDKVVAMVQRTGLAMPIRAEIAAVDQPGIEAQSTPVVQLVPYEAGLKLTVLVRPFGADGPAYVAGLGGRSVLATVNGQQQRANRDLPRELAERTALADACPTLRDRGGSDLHDLVVEDLEGSLDLLLELQAYAGPVAIEWPEGRKLRVSQVTPGKMALRVAQDRDWFNVDGTIALDEDQVLEMRFLLDRLDKAQGRFVPLEDGRFVALTRQLQTQLQRLSAVSEPHKGGRRVHALGAPALDAVLEDAGAVKADAAWKKHVARIRAAEGWTPALPETMQAELRDYQVEGFVWMSRLARWGAGACLADDMGLGKTVQAIAVMLDRAEEGPCLVVAPTSVCPNWLAEIARFAPTLTTHRMPPTGDREALIAGLGARDVLVCSYGLLHQSADLLGARSWQMLVLDEAQAIKNADTKRAQAVQGLQAGFRLALTGTPVENYLDELWSLFNFVNPGVLGSREGFQKRFARPIERDKDPQARQALRALLRPFLLRRTKAAVLSELPPRTEQTLNVEMMDGERVFYETLRQRSLERIAALDAPAGQRKIQILAEITRLRRACCNPALIDAAAGVPSGKLASFLDLVEDLIRNRHKALVFSQFVGHLDLVRAALDERGVRYEYLDGSTPAAEREKRVAAFQAGGTDLFLISLRAGGTGLNLTAADYVVHLDPWWNPAVEDQASDRAHRIGQERPVTIYRLIMQDSIEERIVALHRDKRDLASDLLDGSETAARLSEEALLDLIRG